jgi:hypothetical protein
MDPATAVLIIRASTELATVLIPLLRGWGRNEEADKLDALRLELLSKSDATFDRIIAKGRRTDD